jgi:hypothetical protein
MGILHCLFANARTIRLVAIVLVVLGVTFETTRSAPLPQTTSKGANETLPFTFHSGMLQLWQECQQPQGAWVLFRQEFIKLHLAPALTEAVIKQKKQQWATVLPAALRRMIEADLDTLAAGKADSHVSPAEVLKALDELERTGHFDHWLCAYLWRKTTHEVDHSEMGALIELYARLRRHARLTNALIQGQVAVLPFDVFSDPRWSMGRGMPKLPSEKGPTIEDFIYSATSSGRPLRASRYHTSTANLPALFESADAGTWSRDGIVQFSIAEGSAPLGVVRGGNRWVPRPGQTIRVERLDLIDTPPGKPVILEHAWLGRIELPPDRLVSVWNLPELLAKEMREQVARTVQEAMAGNAEAALKLERALPLVHAALREQLQSSPEKRGAANLRRLLSLFDDAVMPAQPGLAAPLLADPAPLASPQNLMRKFRNQAGPP